MNGKPRDMDYKFAIKVLSSTKVDTQSMHGNPKRYGYQNQYFYDIARNMAIQALKEKYENVQHSTSSSAVDVESAIHARWEMVEKEAFWISGIEESLETGKPTKRAMPVCSHCKTEFGTVVLGYKRCPECGAIMDKEQRSTEHGLSMGNG